MGMYKSVTVAAVENADRRLAEPRDFVVNAIADYENGLTTGFKDGAEWMRKKALFAFLTSLRAIPLSFVWVGLPKLRILYLRSFPATIYMTCY